MTNVNGQETHEKLLRLSCKQRNTKKNHAEVPPNSSENGLNSENYQHHLLAPEERRKVPSFTVGGSVGIADAGEVSKERT